MSQHTPGPWKVEQGGFVGGPVGYGRVCQTWNKFEEDFMNAKANARLIAAAPELLEVARLAAQHTYPRLHRSRMTQLARTAIAKLDGHS